MRQIRVLAAALALAAAVPALAQYDSVAGVPGLNPRPLDGGNAAKVLRGRFNYLHAVWSEPGTGVMYSTSTTGTAWSAPFSFYLNGLANDDSRLPAIAQDSVGDLAVAWIENVNPVTGRGDLMFAAWDHLAPGWVGPYYMGSEVSGVAVTTWSDTTYVVATLVHAGLEQVRVTSFQTLATPWSIVSPGFSQSIDSRPACPNTHFTQPSVAWTRVNCTASLTVAYMFAKDEQTNFNIACNNGVASVGPIVKQRDINFNWNPLWSDLRTTTSPAWVEPVALSLGGQLTGQINGYLFLAYSDLLTGNARTNLARLAPSVNVVTLPSVYPAEFPGPRTHVHVQANSFQAGRFRLSWSGNGPAADPFYGPDAYTSTCDQNLTCAAPAAIDWNLGNFGDAGRPQGVYWKRCFMSQLSTVNFLTEHDPFALRGLFTDYATTPGCTISPIPWNACLNRLTAFVGMGVEGTEKVTLVEVTELGSLVELADDHAVVDTGRGKITVSWSEGTLVSSWEGGFSVSAPKDAVTFKGDEGVRFEVVDLDGK